MFLKTFFTVFWALLLTACSQAPVYTETPLGTLQGYLEDDVEYYLGVPYAQAPTALAYWRLRVGYAQVVLNVVLQVAL